MLTASRATLTIDCTTHLTCAFPPFEGDQRSPYSRWFVFESNSSTSHCVETESASLIRLGAEASKAQMLLVKTSSDALAAPKISAIAANEAGDGKRAWRTASNSGPTRRAVSIGIRRGFRH
ncbi:hypothetical protein [Pseudomonas monteilii]|uniref:hypothetical protein n=1 Tax=Pseudomonas monteilii TaxID=76759 RepID=UPI0012B53C6A|nr:hypothetical protein [Pseudomonas monteilii]